MLKRNIICSILWIVAVAAPTWADELIYRYEGDVLPYDKSAGWSIFNGCDPFCSDWIEDGRYVTQYTGGGFLQL